jgi:hypothetical protein
MGNDRQRASGVHSQIAAVVLIADQDWRAIEEGRRAGNEVMGV